MEAKIQETEDAAILEAAFADPEVEVDATSSQHSKVVFPITHCC